MMNNKKEPNYFLAGSLVIGAIIMSSAWIYSAKIDAKGGASAGSTAGDASYSAPAYAQQQSAPARSSGGCGV